MVQHIVVNVLQNNPWQSCLLEIFLNHSVQIFLSRRVRQERELLKLCSEHKRGILNKEDKETKVVYRHKSELLAWLCMTVWSPNQQYTLTSQHITKTILRSSVAPVYSSVRKCLLSILPNITGLPFKAILCLLL